MDSSLQIKRHFQNCPLSSVHHGDIIGGGREPRAANIPPLLFALQEGRWIAIRQNWSLLRENMAPAPK